MEAILAQCSQLHNSDFQREGKGLQSVLPATNRRLCDPSSAIGDSMTHHISPIETVPIITSAHGDSVTPHLPTETLCDPLPAPWRLCVSPIVM